MTRPGGDDKSARVTDESPRIEGELATRILRGLVVLLGATLGVLVLWLVVARFRYPIDGEWMTGAIRDGVERVRDGKPLYAPPTAEFVPFLYPPLYFWLSGALARVIPTILACKVVSMGATAVTAWGIHRIARANGATPFWARIGLLLHLATYPLTTFFYDLERVDALGGAFVIGGLALLFSRESLRATALAGVTLGLAYFSKQGGALIFTAAVFALSISGQRRRALVAGGAGALAFAAMMAFLEIRTGGWFRYYCVKLPSAHGIKPELISLFFITDAPKNFGYAAASVALSVPLLASMARRRAVPAGRSWRDVVLAASLLAAMVAGFFLRAHFGGWPNVLIAWLPLACAAIAVAGSQAEARAKEGGPRAAAAVSALLLGGVCLQLLGAMFDPMELSPNAADLREREQLVGLVRSLEREGDVLLTTTGNVTRKPSVHAAALFDIVRAGDRAPPDLLEALTQRRYAALLVGTPDEFLCKRNACNELVRTIVENYFVAGHRHERDRNGMSGFDARPRWLLRPRKNPLPHLEARRLFLRMHVEMGFADMKSARFPMESEIEPSDDVEQLAATEVELRTSTVHGTPD